MGASFIPTVPPSLTRFTYFLLNRLTNQIYPSSLLVLFFRLELITATNTAITTATTPPITEVLILNNLHFLKELYHDVGASFIPTITPSIFRLRLGKWLRKLMWISVVLISCLNIAII